MRTSAEITPGNSNESVDLASTATSARRARPSFVYFGMGLFIADLLAIVAGFLLGYYLRFHASVLPYEEYHPLQSFAGTLMLFTIFAPIIFGANGLYRPSRSVSWLDQTYGVFVGVSVGIALAMVVGAFLWVDAPFSRLMTALVWLATVVTVTICRFVMHRAWSLLRARGLDEAKVLIVGVGETARLIAERMRHSPRTGYRPIGCVSEQLGTPILVDLPILGTIDSVGEVARQHGIDDIVIAAPTLSPQKLLDVVGQCSTDRVNIKVYPDLFQLMTSGVDIADLNGLPLLNVKDVALRGWNLTLKRGLDFVVSSIALIVGSPFFLLTALAIKLDSPRGGVFFCQERVGLDGKPFQTIKFRTMHHDAEASTGPVWATADDPRKTRIGALLRRTSIDELPQLINVFLGEMSLVGPRPERPYFVEQFRQTVPRYFERHREKAGLTGWAQVNGLRGNTSIEERTAYDLWYVENWTLWLDIKILLRTVLVIFKGENAY